jgi:ornithine carbamoyltransferase
MKHLLSLEALSVADFEAIFSRVPTFKQQRGHHVRPLNGQTWALIFSKSSTRTRVSFEVGLRELGAEVLFLNANDIQLGRGEPIRDTARVLGRMIHGVVIRTFAQSDVEQFAQFSGIPTVNALTDDEHPCQILTDIFTFQERRRESIGGKIVTYVGDAACNVPASWIFAAARLGFELRLAAPAGYQPAESLLHRAGGTQGPALPGTPLGTTCWYFPSGAKVIVTPHLNWAATGADLLYTDVWVSMGKESESAERLRHLEGYQINGELLKRAKSEALVMHCLPAYRGKEIDAETLEAHADTIFSEAENRLHVQKAIVDWMIA